MDGIPQNPSNVPQNLNSAAQKAVNVPQNMPQGVYATPQVPYSAQQPQNPYTPPQVPQSSPNYPQSTYTDTKYTSFPANVYQPQATNYTSIYNSPQNFPRQYATNYPNQYFTPIQPRKQSNVDLLSGLDFNVTQVPLDPVKAAPAGQTPPPESPPPVVEEAKPVAEEKDTRLDEVDMARYEKDVVEMEAWIRTTFDAEMERRWRDLQQRQERDVSVISVARCYPGRNRCSDSLPYDKNRVELPTPPAADDYINASLVAPSFRGRPSIIVTQAPMAANMTDFWTMVSHRRCDTIVCLATDAELSDIGLPRGYLDPEYGIQVRRETAKPFWLERVLGTVGGREIVHYQLTAPWPTIEGQTVIVSALAGLALELATRTASEIVVHCLTGQGRSGVLSALLMAASDVKTGPRLVDFQTTIGELAAFRKNPLRDRFHLAIAYRSLLVVARSVLPEPPPQPSTSEEPIVEPAPRDPFGDIDPLWKLKL